MLIFICFEMQVSVCVLSMYVFDVFICVYIKYVLRCISVCIKYICFEVNSVCILSMYVLKWKSACMLRMYVLRCISVCILIHFK